MSVETYGITLEITCGPCEIEAEMIIERPYRNHNYLASRIMDGTI